MARYFVPPDGYVGLAGRPRLRISELRLTDTPTWLRGRTLLFASDFHLRPGSDPGRIVRSMAECCADVVLLGGDYADRREQALRLFDALRDLRAPLGIYAVCGNNDTEAFGSHAALADAMERFGARLLVNEVARVCCAGNVLEVGGVDEYRYGAPKPDGLFGLDAGYRILLSHYPVVRGVQADLMLCGHTHGGQFNFFGVTPYSVGFERLGKKRAYAPEAVCGVQRLGGMTLLVSKGIGASRIPLRVGVRPEIHRIEMD